MTAPPSVAVMPKSIYRSEYTTLRELIRELRLAQGVTQETLSEQLGRSQSYISDIERGVRRIDALELRDLCQLLDTDLPGFIGELEKRLSLGRRSTAAASGRKSFSTRGKRKP
jgi:transcriptional regulator with XRE-family HTH domain